jgi:homoserine O-succinyltransferase/O-acetyltransferase
MPVSLNRDLRGTSLVSPAGCIDIGLINNMPDGAMQTTERQFLGLLAGVAGGIVVRLSLYTLPGVPRSNAIRRHIDTFYSDIDNLWDNHLDGLIVTGAEPRAPNLIDEPYWGDLTRVFDWAEHNTLSSVWSCLAAHAAILHMDGIGRRPLSHKRSGVFECARLRDHPLTDGLPQRIRMPHSRRNDIPENELTGCGYRVLTRAENTDVDMFVKRRKSSFVFFQGHPEYETNTLLREYRRDISRYLSREIDTYPTIPLSYIDAETVNVLTAMQERALFSRREESLADFPTALVEGRLANTWRSAAACIYANWLMYICEQKGATRQVW